MTNEDIGTSITVRVPEIGSDGNESGVLDVPIFIVNEMAIEPGRLALWRCRYDYTEKTPEGAYCFIDTGNTTIDTIALWLHHCPELGMIIVRSRFGQHKYCLMAPHGKKVPVDHYDHLVGKVVAVFAKL
jgi:hypothetical protein